MVKIKYIFELLKAASLRNVIADSGRPYLQLATHFSNLGNREYKCESVVYGW
jgi:hypothetical protein